MTRLIRITCSVMVLCLNSWSQSCGDTCLSVWPQNLSSHLWDRYGVRDMAPLVKLHLSPAGR